MIRPFDLDLSPYRDETGWAGLDVRYRAHLTVAAGEPLLRLPEVVASVPGPDCEAADIQVSDETGPITLTEVPGTSDAMSTYRHFVADRDVDSIVGLTLRVPVRVVDVRTPVGPLFDLRREQLGLFGAGVAIVPVPLGGTEYEFSLTWHLDAGVTAISSHGTGSQVRRWSGDVSTIERCLLGAGTPQVAPEGATDFAIHAYSDVPFDLDGLASYLADIHAPLSAFFEDDRARYHVLVRRNPDKGSGGTSFPSSFAFGYSPTTEVDEAALRSLLAHEMVHNWPTLDEDWAVGSWYSEGTAEFYSLVLPWRAGILDPEALAAQLSEMYRRYDANPLKGLSYEQAAERFWDDLRAQTIPYGRGIQYLVRVDGQLRAATGGTTSLDDVVLDILRAQRRGETVTVEGWLARIDAVLGTAARAEYADMVAGVPIPAPEVPFQGLFEPVAVTAPQHRLGFDIVSFHDEPRIVQGVEPDGPAAAGGLRDGDELVTRRFSYANVKDGATPVELVVLRDGVEETVRYVPRGPEVPTTEWRVP